MLTLNKQKSDEEKEIEEREKDYDLNDLSEKLIELKEVEDNFNPELFYLNSKEKYSTGKLLMKNIYNERKELKFVITSQVKKKGKVVNKHSEFKRKIPLIRVGKKMNKITHEEDMRLFFLDEQMDRWWDKIGEFYKDFFMYDFICGNQQYILLSEHELETEEYTITGMVVHIDNVNQITKECKLNQKIPLLFINKVETNKIQFKDHEECINKSKELMLNRDNFFNYLFTLKTQSYRQPEWYENLIAAFLFSAEYDDYRNYLMVIGEPETGKTRHMLAVYNKFDEPQAHTSGSNSTIKGLIPSFNTSPVKMGALIKSIRIHAIDEFLRILGSGNDEEANRRMLLGKLNSLYDGIKELFESGNGSAEGQMNCKVMCVSNPTYGCKNMDMMCNWLDPAFISRNTIYFQNEAHVNRIKSGELLEKARFNIPGNDFKAFYDYFLTFRADYNDDVLKMIYDKLGDGLKSNYGNTNTSDHYKNRQLHHLHCLMDGYIKLRCLVEGDTSFKAKEEDYFAVETIWFNILSSWLDNITIPRVTEEELKLFLNM